MKKKKRMTEIISNNDSIFLINKPLRYSSARVVNIVKKALNIRKAGHSGTLDPLATGLLIIATGKKTKELHQLLDSVKEYEAVMEIGACTKSFDAETEVCERKDITGVTEGMINETAKKLTGEIEQYPPMYSAAKHKGKPLYKFARKNIEIKRELRKVIIYEFSVLNINMPDIRFRIKCSKGTYIRTLVDDFGSMLGTGAYLKELTRTGIGDYSIKDSLTLDEFKQKYNFQEKIYERNGNIPEN